MMFIKLIGSLRQQWDWSRLTQKFIRHIVCDCMASEPVTGMNIYGIPVEIFYVSQFPKTRTRKKTNWSAKKKPNCSVIA